MIVSVRAVDSYDPCLVGWIQKYVLVEYRYAMCTGDLRNGKMYGFSEYGLYGVRVVRVYCTQAARALSLPRGRSLITILLPPYFSPGFRVRFPLVPQPHIDTGCLFDLDLPRPPP